MVQSIDRAISIIKLLNSTNEKEYWAISDIADRTHLPVSTVHRLLNSLIEHGLVMQISETKQYKNWTDVDGNRITTIGEGRLQISRKRSNEAIGL